ncbi:hypothetical protein V6N11_061980 [Hibiscus sabdariffa]|uniref:Non-haem dioxygenase N-terminal domain-containing protein n=1 Tax=Hibiscus sabdariffa TaxID=183260 RepID=A0ABR2PR85_9ROSI
MSNDRYKSIEHRVVANGSKDRVSVPIFMNPRADAILGPLPEVLENTTVKAISTVSSVLSKLCDSYISSNQYAPRDPNSEKIIDFVVNKRNGVKGLVDAGIQTVPELYILPVDERLEPNKILTTDSIPVIDVSNWDDPVVTESICEAAGKWGFFQIINHGVPLEVLDAVKEAAHRFFGLPSEERSKYWAGNSPTETVALKTSFVPQAETVLEWKDNLSFRCSPRDLESFPLWPPVCRDEVVKYMESAEPVIRKLLEVLLKGLKVEEIDEAREYTLMASPYRSIEHRVVANGSKDRVSVLIFVNPGADAIFGPLPEVLESGEQPLYKEVVYSDYFKYFFSKRHEGKKTMEFARI